jgi:hypothetical protein
MLSKIMTWRVGLLFLAQASSACSSGSNSGGASTFRGDAQFAYVMYLDGPCDASTSVDIDLDTGAVRVGTGPSQAQSARRATMTKEEVSTGRRLFEQDQIAAYQHASLPAGAAQTSTGGSLPSEEVDGSGGDGSDGTGPTDTPPTAPSTCTRDADSPIGVTIYEPPGMYKRTSLMFDKSDTAEPPVSEMLEYFSELADRYHP